MVCTFESCAGLMISLVCFVVSVVGETVLLMEAASFVIAVADSWFVGSKIDSAFETLVSSIFSFLTASTGCSSLIGSETTSAVESLFYIVLADFSVIESTIGSSFETCSMFGLTFIWKSVFLGIVFSDSSDCF